MNKPPLKRGVRYYGKHPSYTRVYVYENRTGIKTYQANVGGNSKQFKSDREAAKCVDIWLIKNGKVPVNVLK